MNVVGTLLSPILASVSHWWASITTFFLPIEKIGNSRLKMFLFLTRALIGARVFEGLGGGVTFPGTSFDCSSNVGTWI